MAWQYADWQQRVILDRYELSCKIERLRVYIDGDNYPKLKRTDRNHLSDQLRMMNGYLFILGLRIARFKKVRVKL